MWTSNVVKKLFRFERRLEDREKFFEEKLGRLEQRLNKMTQEVDDIKAAVTNIGDATTQAITQIQSEVATILANGQANPGMSQADKDSLEASVAAINATADGVRKVVADAQAALATPPAPAPGS